MKAHITPTPANVPNRTVRSTPTNTDQQSVVSTKPASAVEASAPSGSGAPEGDSLHEEGMSFST